MKESNFPKLKNSTIKLLSGEKLFIVQRKHWIAIVIPMLVHVVTLTVVFLAFIFAPQYGFFPEISQALVAVTLLLLSLLAIIGTYTIMDWLFEFYVITNRRVIHVHFFKTKGIDFDEYFFAEGAQTEINKVVTNFIYDLLEVEDIHLGFMSIERAEPFIIETPSNPKAIYELIEKLFMKKRRES